MDPVLRWTMSISFLAFMTTKLADNRGTAGDDIASKARLLCLLLPDLNAKPLKMRKLGLSLRCLGAVGRLKAESM